MLPIKEMKLDIDVDESAKNKAEMTRANFYLKKAVLDAFRKECEKQGVVMSKLLQNFMEAFIKQGGKK